MIEIEDPTRPSNHPSESQSPGWTGTGGMKSEQDAAHTWQKAIDRQRDDQIEAAQKSMLEKEASGPEKEADDKQQRIAERAEQISEQFVLAKSLTQQHER